MSHYTSQFSILSNLLFWSEGEIGALFGVAQDDHHDG